jgi:hypothetical protein
MQNFRNKQGIIDISACEYPQKGRNNGCKNKGQEKLSEPSVQEKDRNQVVNNTISEENEHR